MTTLSYELPLVFLSGILGSAHCIGMCGAISATMNLGTVGVRGSLMRQLLWSAGRIFTYGFLGLVAAFAATQLTRSSLAASAPALLLVQAGLAVLAGGLLVLQGLGAAGWWRSRRTGAGRPSVCVAASVFGRFLQGGSASGVLVAGLLTGFLPCGLVYSFVALAAATASLWKGSLLMIVFGLGTVPVMLVTGVGFTMASLRLRQRLMKLAAVCVLVTGLLTAGRGILFAAAVQQGQSAEHACPLCADQQAESPADSTPVRLRTEFQKTVSQ